MPVTGVPPAGRRTRVIVAVPSVNATVPPSGTGLTVAVQVTFCPATDGSAEDASVVAVAVTGVITDTVCCSRW